MRTRNPLRPVTYALTAMLILLLALTHITGVYDSFRDGTDFEATVWEPIESVLGGRTPYPDLEVAPRSVYPPSGFLPALPIALLPFGTAVVIWQALLGAASLATLWILRVRDVRCYFLFLLSPVTLEAVLVGNVTPVVVLLAAATWVLRGRAGLAGLALGAAIAIKLFVAPLVLWMLLTRRFAAALWCVTSAVLMITVAWAAIGFDALLRYPTLMNRAAEYFEPVSPLLHGLLRQAGLDRGATTAIAVSTFVVCLAFAVRCRTNDLKVFTLMTASVLVLSPIAWVYYAAVLVVPLAVRFPRFAWPWTLFAFFWVGWWHSPLPYGTLWLSAPTTLISLALVASTLGLRAAGGRATATSPATVEV